MNDLPEAIEGETHDVLRQARRVLARLEQQISLLANPVDGTAAIFYEDEVFQIALPWASFDGYQSRIIGRRSVPDPTAFVQLFDLIPNLTGRAILDVGSYTGLTALVLRRFLNPSKLVMVEPQNVMRQPLMRTIEANPEGCPVELLNCVIDDGTSPMIRAVSRPDRLSESTYIRREGGTIVSQTIDGLRIEKLGIINLDIPGQKIYALRGARQTLETDRPAVIINLLGRDADEIKTFCTEINYDFVRAGDNAAILLPN